MSADNGIYIGKFPRANDPTIFEYRVIHAQAIENCDDDPSGKFPNWLTDAYVVIYYGNAPTHFTEREALDIAGRMLAKVDTEDGICEYGICSIEYTRPMKSISYEQAKSLVDGYFDDCWDDGVFGR